MNGIKLEAKKVKDLKFLKGVIGNKIFYTMCTKDTLIYCESFGYVALKGHDTPLRYASAKSRNSMIEQLNELNINEFFECFKFITPMTLEEMKTMTYEEKVASL